MNSGVYCKPRSCTTVYNSILIDRYEKIISGDNSKLKSTDQVEENKMDISDDFSHSEENKWECGMNVRAYFSEDGEYYEAVIEKIENDSAIVRYLGYENEEEVELKNLKPSLGVDAINEQMMDAGETEDRGFGFNECDYGTRKIDWKPGMKCRALYEKNEVIYEAVVQEVNQFNRTAVVVMIGYGIPYEVSFDKMYESIPELLQKQEKSAMNFHKTRSGHHPEHPENKKTEMRIPHNFHNTDDQMFTPQNESEALACMLSSTYLSGYYAGYYDCMKKSADVKK